MAYGEIVKDPRTGEEFEITWTGDADRLRVCQPLVDKDVMTRQEGEPKRGRSAHGGYRSHGPIRSGTIT